MRTSTPAQNKALLFLRALVDDLNGSGQRRLPRQIDLAKSAGVSQLAMWKAVQQLKKEGLLQTNHRMGTRIAAPPDASADLRNASGYHGQSAVAKWKRTAQALYEDILAGRYTEDEPLPPAKFLAERYRCGVVTIRRALRELTGDSVLEHVKRDYRVGGRGSRTKGKTLILVAEGNDTTGIALQYERPVQQFMCLEDECFRAGISLSLALFDTISGSPVPCKSAIELLRRKGRADSTIGFVVFSIALSGNPVDIIQRLAPFGKPVAVLDEMGDFLGPVRSAGNKNFHAFAVGCGETAGRAMGRYLVNSGHKKVAFISPYKEEIWSRNRIAGLKYAFAQAGQESAVSVYASERTIDQRTFLVAGQGAEEIISKQAILSEGRSLETAHLLREIIPRIDSINRRSAVRSILQSVFGELISSSHATAWVAVNDTEALMAIDFLRQRDDPVSGKIAVCGFDDIPESVHSDLTTYNFNVPGIVHAAFSFVMDTHAFRRWNTNGFLTEIEGTLKVRGSGFRPGH